MALLELLASDSDAGEPIRAAAVRLRAKKTSDQTRPSSDDPISDLDLILRFVAGKLGQREESEGFYRQG